jgi:hypothetical protein
MEATERELVVKQLGGSDSHRRICRIRSEGSSLQDRW